MSEYITYTNEQIVNGLKLIRVSSLDNIRDWHENCVKIIDKGFNSSDLKIQMSELEKISTEEEQNMTIAEASKAGVIGHALNFLWNYLESYASAQYVRLQFEDLLDNFIANVKVSESDADIVESETSEEVSVVSNTVVEEETTDETVEETVEDKAEETTEGKKTLTDSIDAITEKVMKEMGASETEEITTTEEDVEKKDDK